MAKTSRNRVSSERNVFFWLDEVQLRTSMFFNTLRQLEFQICGYYTALGVHRVVEDVPDMEHHFRTWLGRKTGWSTCAGWAVALEEHISDPAEQVAEFFRFVEEYRRLRPRVLCTVLLGRRHEPTGKRVVFGFDTRMDKPRRVDVLRYEPEPLHFLRLHYRGYVVDRDLLMKSDGSHDTSILDAKRWVRDELQVKRHEWQSRR